MIRCIRGKIFDVFVDLRKDSPTFGQWDSVELSEDINKMILLPADLHTDSVHLQTNVIFYINMIIILIRRITAGLSGMILMLNINWPVEDIIISEKDRKLMTFSRFKD